MDRMSGEQIWDSLVTLTFPEVDTRKLQPRNNGYEDYERYTEMTGEQLFAEVMRRTGIDPNAQAAMAEAMKVEMNPSQKNAVDTVMKYADLYCVSCHDSGACSRRC